jgi:putative peptide zinc metalloprotease protein
MIDDADPLLPVLRADIEVIKGPAASDGGLTWLIHDPVKGTFDKASWDQVEIIKRLVKRWHLSELVADLQAHTTLDVTAEELIVFIQGLAESGLLGTARVKDQAALIQEAEAGKASWLSELLRHYLYFRIPLIYPADFLKRTVHYFRPLGSTPAFWLYGLILLAGLFMVGQQPATYFHTFGYFFNLRGMAVYAVALILLKVVHEFSHAYVSTALGCRVRTMGVAFMVLWPVAFCDVTDSWRLASRSKRLRISFAGILAEAVIAAVALLMWGLLPPGPPRSICFVLSSVTIVSTLLVNLNPAMRFDGYYIFSDLFGVDNLQQTAFTYARGVIYRGLFGIAYQPTENYTARQKVFMVLYSINTWIYRFGLYLGIAILVYYKFTKSLGLILFLTEILFFLIKPIGRQLQMVWKMRKMMKPRRALAVVVVLVLWFGWCCIPLPRTLQLPAVTELDEFQHVYASQAGVLTAVEIARDADVQRNQILFTIESRQLQEEIRQLELESKRLRLEISRLSTLSSGKAALPAKREEIVRNEMRRESLRRMLDQCALKSLYSGQVYQWDDAIKPGLAVQRGQLLCCIGNPQSLLIKAYLKEKDLGGLPADATCAFIDNSTLKRYEGRILRCSPLRSRFIPYEALTSLAGGDIAVVPRAGHPEVLESYYEAEVQLLEDAASLRMNQIGRLEVETLPRSLFRRTIDAVYSVFIRESAF